MIKDLPRRPLAWGLILFFLALLLTVYLAESRRPWKKLQRDFLALERQRLNDELASERQKADGASAALDAEIAIRRQEAVGKEGEIDRLEEELAGLRRRSKVARSRLDALRQEPAPDREALRQARLELESLSELEEGLELELSNQRRDVRELEERRDQEQMTVRELEDRLRALKDGWLGNPLAPRATKVTAWPRSTPWGPATRIDRCVTCHLAVDREAVMDGAQPFLGHPRLDLFVAYGSPHPQDRFGCTPCHGGEGRALDFARAGHVPRDPQQAAQWTERWGWSAAELPREPILAGTLVEARCGSCHAGGEWIPEASRFHRGLELSRVLGCGGCHGERRSEAEPSGPSLERLAAKTEAGWVYRWLTAPRELRATTAMPHLFVPETAASELEGRHREAEMRAIVAYLWERSVPWQAAELKLPDGDPAAGEKLFRSVGCDGCHLLSVGAAGRQAFLGELERLHGPNLAQIGDKVDGSWLYNWLRDPKSYHPTTTMPDLRLSRSEAADLTAFLLAQGDPAWEGRVLPEVDAEARDALALAHLERELTLEGSRARLEAMGAGERELYLGERSIARYGCPTCHRIPGFSVGPRRQGAGYPSSSLDMQRQIASRLIRPARLRQRLHHPAPTSQRSSDDLLGTDPLPDYGLSEAELELLLPVVLSWSMPSWSSREGVLTVESDVLERGRRIAARFHCRGCHRLEGHGGAPSTWKTRPPDLTHEGNRVKPSWLQDYLHDPSRWPLRAWSAARMPTFAMSDDEIDALVAYFAALSGTSLLVGDPPFSARDTVVGEVAFGMLHCDRCHNPSEARPEQLAPPYDLARQRLRPEWVIDWILEPRAALPDTPMSQILAREVEDQSDAFLAVAIGAPMFWQERNRLQRLFASEEELLTTLSDPEQVARALRAYLWSLDPGTTTR